MCLKNYNRTCFKQWTGHDMVHLKHWLHRILFNVQVLLCLLTFIAFELQINSHFPHKLHWLILFPMRHRDLYLTFKSSEKINLPISSPIDDDPPRCLKFKISLIFNYISFRIQSYKYFGTPKFFFVNQNPVENKKIQALKNS